MYVDLDLVLFTFTFALYVFVTTFARGCFRCTCMLSHILEFGLLTTVIYLINYHVFSYTGKLHWTYDYTCLFVHSYIQLIIILYIINILTIYISNG